MIHRVELSGWKCDQCNHAWLANNRPNRCPNRACRALADSIKHSRVGRPAKLVVLLLLLFAAKGYAQLPDAPSAVADRNFWILTSANAASTFADAYTTVALVGHTQRCPFEVWNAPLYGRQPQVARTTLVMGGLFAASVVASYELKKHNVHIWKLKLWAAPQAYLAYGHANGAIQNLRTCR